MTHSGIQQIPPAQMKGDLLVVTAHDSIYPVLWRMDRGTLRTAAFDVVQVDALWQLRFKPLNDSPRDIAHYTDRAGAIALLTHIQSALMGERPVQGLSFVCMPSPLPRVEQMILTTVAVILFVTLSMMLFRLMPSPNSSSSVSSGPRALSAPIEPGVPQSADDLLLQQGDQ